MKSCRVGRRKGDSSQWTKKLASDDHSSLWCNFLAETQIFDLAASKMASIDAEEKALQPAAKAVFSSELFVFLPNTLST